MRTLLAPVLWAYDFLAEDTILLVGAAIAILVTALLIHTVHDAAGYVLIVMVLLTVSTSLWRTATTQRR